MNDPPDQDVRRRAQDKPSNHRITDPNAARGDPNRVGGANPDGVGGRELMTPEQREAVRQYIKIARRAGAAAAGFVVGGAVGYVVGELLAGDDTHSNPGNASQPEPEPEPTPSPRPGGVPLPLTHQDDEGNPVGRMISDSGIFMRHTADKQFVVDQIFNDDRLHMLMPLETYKEVNLSWGLQSARVARVGSRLETTTIDPTTIPGRSEMRLSRKGFGFNDMMMMEVARRSGLPVVSSNTALVRQIQSELARGTRYDHIPILRPGYDFHTSQQLLKQLQALRFQPQN